MNTSNFRNLDNPFASEQPRKETWVQTEWPFDRDNPTATNLLHSGAFDLDEASPRLVYVTPVGNVVNRPTTSDCDGEYPPHMPRPHRLSAFDTQFAEEIPDTNDIYTVQHPSHLSGHIGLVKHCAIRQTLPHPYHTDPTAFYIDLNGSQQFSRPEYFPASPTWASQGGYHAVEIDQDLHDQPQRLSDAAAALPLNSTYALYNATMLPFALLHTVDEENDEMSADYVGSNSPFHRDMGDSIIPGPSHTHHSIPAEQDLFTSPVYKKQVASAGVRDASVSRRTNHPIRTCPHQFCEQTFTTGHNLKNHIKSHSGEKPYRCGLAECSKAFTTNSDRKRHERIHQG